MTHQATGGDPAAVLNPPQIPDELPLVLTDDELRRLLKACEGRDFTDCRDAAILRLFLDTGIRVSEAAGITLPATSTSTTRWLSSSAGGADPGGAVRPQDRACA
jgi:site-specific recombinase XerD